METKNVFMPWAQLGQKVIKDSRKYYSKLTKGWWLKAIDEVVPRINRCITEANLDQYGKIIPTSSVGVVFWFVNHMLTEDMLWGTNWSQFYDDHLQNDIRCRVRHFWYNLEVLTPNSLKKYDDIMGSKVWRFFLLKLSKVYLSHFWYVPACMCRCLNCAPICYGGILQDDEVVYEHYKDCDDDELGEHYMLCDQKTEPCKNLSQCLYRLSLKQTEDFIGYSFSALDSDDVDESQMKKGFDEQKKLCMRISAAHPPKPSKLIALLSIGDIRSIYVPNVGDVMIVSTLRVKQVLYVHYSLSDKLCYALLVRIIANEFWIPAPVMAALIEYLPISDYQELLKIVYNYVDAKLAFLNEEDVVFRLRKTKRICSHGSP
jgi:hypothetical protein